MLYLVPLPKDHPDDISFRALRILREVDVIAGDSSPALAQHGITPPLVDLDALWAALEAGQDAALTLVDSLYREVVTAALARGITVEPLPGANTVLTALVASGLPTDRFMVTPHLDADAPLTQVIMSDTVKMLLNTLEPERPACVVAGEQVWRGTVETLRAAELPDVAVLVVGAAEAAAWDEARVRAAFQKRLAAGESRSQAAKAVAAASGWKKSDIYDLQ